MASWIDWHSHHTAPEVVEQFAAFAGKKPKIDDYDSTDFAKRVKEMNEAGLDLQLICQGAGLYADQLPADQALKIMRSSNTSLAERIAPHRGRLIGMTALSQKNIAASVEELERTAQKYPSSAGRFFFMAPVWRRNPRSNGSRTVAAASPTPCSRTRRYLNAWRA